MVVQDQTEMFLNLNHHPVCAASDASHFLLTGAATPPGQEGRCRGLPSFSPSFLDRDYIARFNVGEPIDLPAWPPDFHAIRLFGFPQSEGENAFALGEIA